MALRHSGRLSAFAALMLAGCGSPLSLLAPGIPSGAQLDTYAKDFALGYRIGETPRDTLVIGISYVDQQCSDFFDAVEQLARRTEVFKSGFSTASTQTLALMAAAERSALRIAQVAAAFEITKALLNEYREQYTFAPHLSELRSLVTQAMTGQRKELGGVIARQTGPAEFSEVDAVAAVKRYAENCTLATIREHWNRAMAKAVRDGVKPDVPVDSPAAPRAGGAPGALRATGDRPLPPQPSNILGVNRYVVR